MHFRTNGGHRWVRPALVLLAAGLAGQGCAGRAGGSVQAASANLIDLDADRLAALQARIQANRKAGGSPGRDVLAVAQAFLGRPYAAGSLDAPGAGEQLVCNTRSFDCVTLVENSLAIARALRDGDPGAYPGQLEALRYRGARRQGYLSRLHYFSEWIRDNAAQGLVQDCSQTLGGIPDPRPLHFMTSHPQHYPPLGNDLLLQGMAAIERCLSREGRCHVPKDRVAAIEADLQDGDILAITTRIEGLDVGHVGIACRQPDGRVHLLHALRPGEPVQVSGQPLLAYLMESERRTGIMVARPN